MFLDGHGDAYKDVYQLFYKQRPLFWLKEVSHNFTHSPMLAHTKAQNKWFDKHVCFDTARSALRCVTQSDSSMICTVVNNVPRTT